MLSFILPSACYAKDDKTLDGLHAAVAQDLRDVFETGVEVMVSGLELILGFAGLHDTLVSGYCATYKDTGM